MIRSSADILRILGASEIIRLAASVKIIDGRPPITGSEENHIYISRFPQVEEFQATWLVYIEAEDDTGLIVSEVKKLLPGVKAVTGLLTTLAVTDFYSERTEVAPEKPKTQAAEVDLTSYEKRFQDLVEDVQDRMLLVNSGRPGKDGQDGQNGRDGRDGRDGKDIDATETELFDLKNVSQSILPMEKGQVLTWDGLKWTNLYVKQVQTLFGGGGGGDGENVIVADAMPSTREDGSELQEGDQWWSSLTGVMYIWYVDADSSQWVQSSGSNGGNGVKSLGDLSDVTIDPAELASDQGLLYNGTEWVVGSPPVIIEVHNQSGSLISKGTPVYVSGTHSSGKPTVEEADSNGADTFPAIGLVDRDLASGTDGYVLISGKLFQVDTDTPGWNAGDALYLSTTPGVLTNIRPSSASEKVQKVGLVTRRHPTVGTILVIGAGRINDVPNELTSLTGAGYNAADLGTFAGTTISDNASIKNALQELEFAVQGGSGGGIPDAPTDGQYYVRQNATWRPTTTASISYNLSQNQLSDLGDTAISGAQPGEALIWNGVAWANGGDFTGGSF
jgi:hypothetical protein